MITLNDMRGAQAITFDKTESSPIGAGLRLSLTVIINYENQYTHFVKFSLLK